MCISAAAQNVVSGETLRNFSVPGSTSLAGSSAVPYVCSLAGYQSRPHLPYKLCYKKCHQESQCGFRNERCTADLTFATSKCYKNPWNRTNHCVLCLLSNASVRLNRQGKLWTIPDVACCLARLITIRRSSQAGVTRYVTVCYSRTVTTPYPFPKTQSKAAY